jgi:hypothetical protein
MPKYWNGPGVLMHPPTKEDPRTEIKPGEEVPADIPADTLKSLIKKGKIGNAPASGPVAVPNVTDRLQIALAEVEQLRGELADALGAQSNDELLAENAALKIERDEALALNTKLIEQMAGKDERIDTLGKELAEANAMIAALTAPPADAAGPKGGKK